MTDGIGHEPRTGGPITGGVPRVLGGRYELGPEIGRGGMAEVFAGRDTRLGRSVAVKVLKTDLARDPSFQSRFKREAQSAASLNHPAIVAVYDTGDELLPSGGGTTHLPYIVMEYLRGRTLKEILSEHGRLSVDDSLRVSAGVLDALQYSHRNGIVHRDIKPANVMVTDAGEIKVMDFGIARAITDTGATMTGTNAVLGTAQYLSPEQAKGETVDNRSDLYSTACLLYELLTGRPPFVGDSPVSLAYQHVGEQPQPPSTLVPGLPPDLDRVVMRGLSKDRTMRYQTAEDFISDLDRVATGVPVAADATQLVTPPGDPDRTQRLQAAGAGAGAPTAAWPAVGAATGAAAATAVGRPAGYGDGGYVAQRYDDYDTGYGRGYPDEPRRRSLLWLWILLAVLALAAVAALATVFLNDGGGDASPDPSDSVSVPAVAALPDLRNQNVDAAEQTLAALGFTNVTTQPQTSTEAEPNTVLSQTPSAGPEVRLDTPIVLTVAAAPDSVAVPDVTGRSQDEALRLLEDAGLRVTRVSTEDSPTLDADKVIRTEPGSGQSVPKETGVVLVISSGLVSVPDVRGLDVNDALKALSDAGLQARQTSEPSTEPTNTVLDQDPPADQGKVTRGSTVNITVSVQSAPPSTPSPTTTSPSAPASSSPSSSPTSSDGAAAAARKVIEQLQARRGTNPSASPGASG